MTQELLTYTENGLIIKNKSVTLRYPNLGTVLMIEHILETHKDIPMTIAELKKNLPKKVMHQTLKIILEYLFKSGKIIYGPRGIQWIYVEPEHLKKMLKNTIEL